MAAKDDEEELLRSVALRNARSILLARQRAEEALRKQSEWLRITLSSIGDAVISTDAEDRVTFMNGVASALTGWTQAEAVGRPLPDIFHIVNEQTRQPVENPALRALREGTIVGLANHTILIARDGTERPIDDSAAPIRDDSGARVGAVLVFRDVSERKRAEKAVRAANERATAILESINEGFVVLDADWRFTYVNAAFERMNGVRREDIIGQNHWEAYPATVGTPLEAEYRRVLAEGVTAEFEHYYPPWDRWFAVKAYPAQGGGLCVQLRDVSDAKRAEAAVRQRDERLQLFLGNATDYAIIMTDPGGRVLEWKGGAEQITGWREDEMLGRPADVIFTSEDRAAGVPAEEMRKAGSVGRAEDKRWHQRKDGSRFFADGVMVSLRGPGGELRGFGKVLRDDTDRKRAEDELKDTDRKKDEFIALLAHELRNPLAPLRNGLQVMRLAGGDTNVIDKARSMMERQLGHMVRLIDDLLDVSRISQNKMELRRSRVLLTDVVSSAVETARPVIEAAGHELTLSLPQGPVFLDADLTRLAQVFSNLLTNSAKYTEFGGRIWLAAELRDREVVVSVQDTGIGIPADALPRIFDMFSQVDRSIERSTGGLGIGLALVKGLVEMHDGTVAAASEGQGKGSTFIVKLPLLGSRTEPQPANPSDNAQTAAGPRRRILIVDDNPDGADSLAMMLRLLNNEVRTAHDGIEAVEAAEQFRPQVILMDVGMPRLNGLDATRRIREQAWGKAMIVIALTGWGQEADRQQSQDAGCDGHLVKPVSLLDLEQLLVDISGAD